jgi:hypothetical protein
MSAPSSARDGPALWHRPAKVSAAPADVPAPEQRVGRSARGRCLGTYNRATLFLGSDHSTVYRCLRSGHAGDVSLTRLSASYACLAVPSRAHARPSCAVAWMAAELSRERAAERPGIAQPHGGSHHRSALATLRSRSARHKSRTGPPASPNSRRSRASCWPPLAIQDQHRTWPQ